MSDSRSSTGSSTNSSPNQILFLSSSADDLVLYGSPAPVALNRTVTVRRAPERVRRSLDASVRSGLDSISESSDCARRSHSEADDGRTLDSTDWLGCGVDDEDRPPPPDVTNGRFGEWNNFWLNYSSARGRYLSSSYVNSSEGGAGDERSETRSIGSSTQREGSEADGEGQVWLSVQEANEALKCTQRLSDILQAALKRNEEMEVSREESYYSSHSYRHNSTVSEIVMPRERSYSYAVDPKDLQKQKQLLKPTNYQTSSTSCINALLSTSVADILKKVISKRRDVVGPDDIPSVPSRSSFSEWSTTK